VKRHKDIFGKEMLFKKLLQILHNDFTHPPQKTIALLFQNKRLIVTPSCTQVDTT
jgi:hypothetical protein